MLKNKLMSIAWILGACVVMVSLHSCEKVDNPGSGDLGTSSELSSKFKNYELIEVDNFDELYSLAKSEPSSPVVLDLKVKSHPDWKFEFSMDQSNKDIFDNTEFYNIDDNDNKTVVQLDRVYGLSGKIKNAEVTSLFLFNKDYFEGEIIDGEKSYYIEQANKFDNGLAENVYIVYDQSEVLGEGDLGCEPIGELPKDEIHEADDTKGAMLAGHTKKADVAYVGDYQLYRKFGSWSGAHNYMYNRMVYASKRYYDYNNVPLELRKRYGGLYTGTGGNQPRTYWDSYRFTYEWQAFYNRPLIQSQNADVHYLFTGYNVGGSVKGRAFLGTVCVDRPRSFAWGEYVYSNSSANNIMAHEIGHVFGCNHVSGSWQFMSPSSSTAGYGMATQTRNELNNMLRYRSFCLSY